MFFISHDYKNTIELTEENNHNDKRMKIVSQHFLGVGEEYTVFF